MADVAVIGAGVAGIQAALDIADHGLHVHLIEREPTIGGHMAQLDKTFPTNDCSMCILSPKMADVMRHPCITVHTCTEVERVEGERGKFRLTLRKNPRYIVEEDCDGCGSCIQCCPVEVYNRFDAGIGVRKAIYKPHSQAMPDIVIKDAEHCIECGLCYDVCERGAIKKEDEAKVFEIGVASIVVATGYRTFDPSEKPQLGFPSIPDVITSIEFERMINASGPTGGRVKRLSDGTTPREVVFIQCVGSRDYQNDRPWCSGTCCMAAVKHALLIREKYPSTRVIICYIDLRAYGKGYEEYYQRAEQQGVIFLRGIPAEISTGRTGIRLQVENTETGEVQVLAPELVVLSVGQAPREDAAGIARMLGIEADEHGYMQPADTKLGPVLTIRPGIYVAGAVSAPRDIPDCVALGQAAAMQAFLDAIADE